MMKRPDSPIISLGILARPLREVGPLPILMVPLNLSIKLMKWVSNLKPNTFPFLLMTPMKSLRPRLPFTAFLMSTWLRLRQLKKSKREANDVFRYEDEETGATHYMTGEPGKAVEGGWAFTNPDGTFKLVYKADEMGFQPEAEHIPVPVEDTNEVTEAKATFYSLFDEHKAKVDAAIAEDAAAVVDARRKREAHGHGFKFHPYHGLVPVGAKDDTEEVKKFKFLPYHGFVPADETVEGEEILLKNLHPYHKKMTDKRFKLDPYHGFVPILEEEPEVKEFKFLPYHGYIPADETVEGEEELLKKLHPYHQKLAEKRFKLHPYHGFVPIMKMEEAEESTAGVVTARKKRDTDEVEKNQDLILPPPPHPYNFHPILGLVPGAVKPEDSENKLYKYVPYYGFVPLEGEEGEEDAEETDAEEDEGEEMVKYKYDPLYGFVKADQEIKPLEEQEYKYTPYVGFVPVNEDGEIEETAKDYGNLKYTFHPYYGFLPTPTDGEDKTQLYKLDPVVGFYPSEKTEEVEEEVAELEAKRRKREAQFPLYPVFVQQQLVPLYPQQPLTEVNGVTEDVAVPGRVATEEETDEKTEEEKPAVVPIAPLQLVPLNWRIPVAYPGIVPVNQVLPAAQVIYPVQGQTMLPEDKFPVIPHAEDNNKPGPVIL